MPVVISTVLAPYLEPSPVEALTLITSTASATANWLLLRFIHASVTGAGLRESGSSKTTKHNATRPHDESITVFASFVRSFSMWSEMGKRVGLDFATLTTSKRLVYVDGLEKVSRTTNHATNAQTTRPGSGILNSIESIIRDSISSNALNAAEGATRVTLVLDGIDFFMATQPDLTPLMISQFLMRVRRLVNSTIVVFSADTPLLHHDTGSATLLESRHLALATMIAHQAGRVMQLRSLDTGAAPDVTGVLRTSLGGAHEADGEEDSKIEGEWLYQIKGDGSVRLWSRGE